MTPPDNSRSETCFSEGPERSVRSDTYQILYPHAQAQKEHVAREKGLIKTGITEPERSRCRWTGAADE
jgi:hypothetical protein